MNRRTELFCGFSMVLSYSAFVCWLFCVTLIENGCTTMRFHGLAFVGFYLAVYLLDVLMTKRKTNLAIYVGFTLLMAACSVLLFLGVAELKPLHIGTVIFMSIFTAGGVLACGYTGADPIGPKNLIFYFDSMGALMILLLLIDHVFPLLLVTQTLMLCFAAMVFTMICLVVSRTQRDGSSAKPPHRGGRLMIGAVVGVILLISALLVAVAGSGAQTISEAFLSVFRTLWNGFLTAGRFLMDKLEQFLTWLIQFLPDDGMDGNADMTQVSVEGGMPSGSRIQLPRYFLYIALGIGALWLIRFLLSMRREKVAEAAPDYSVNTTAKRTGTLFSGLKRLFLEILQWIHVQYLTFRCRKTAPGLLLWCQKHAPKEHRPRAGESGPAYLLRLSELTEIPAQKEALQELSRLTELCFYSTQPQPVSPELFKTIRQCKL